MEDWKDTEFGLIPESWRLVKAQDYYAHITDGTHDSPKRKTKGKYLITSKHLKGRQIDFNEAYKISVEDYDKINKRSYVEQWDVLISMIGAYCGFTYIERNEKINYAVKNVGIFKTQSKLNALWLHYFLESPIGKHILNFNKSGSSQPYISLGALRNLPILIAPLPEQKAIASVLSSLDDKMGLLHRQNQTLEAMAETLFREWFVEQADEDWEEVELGEILTTKGGGTPSTRNEAYWNGDINWTSPRDITSLNSIHLFKTERKITELGLGKISSGILPQGTLLMSSRAPVGVLAFAEIPVAINQGYIAIIDDKGFSKEFIYLWLKKHMKYVKSYANGSTFLEISKRAFNSLLFTQVSHQINLT